jgi:hypothetical protein
VFHRHIMAYVAARVVAGEASGVGFEAPRISCLCSLFDHICMSYYQLVTE